MPKPVIPYFDTSRPDTYLDFKSRLKGLLIYESESLNISTMMSAIRGKDKDYALNLVKHNMQMLMLLAAS